MSEYKFDIINKFKYTKDTEERYHSYNDKPAIEYFDGTKIWMTHGQVDRDEHLGPALITNNGVEEYYEMNQKHCLWNHGSDGTYYADNMEVKNMVNCYTDKPESYVHNGSLKTYIDHRRLFLEEKRDMLYVTSHDGKTYFTLPLNENTYIVEYIPITCNSNVILEYGQIVSDIVKYNVKHYFPCYYGIFRTPDELMYCPITNKCVPYPLEKSI